MVSYLVDDNSLTNEVVPVPFDSSQATSLVIARVRQLTNKLIEYRGHDEPPFLPEDFVPLLGIDRIEKVNLGEASAVLLRLSEGYVIKVNEKHHPLRRNFSCAHEIGHILLNGLKPLEYYLQNIEYRTFNPKATTKIRERTIERLCNVAATELLMPELVFGKNLSRFGASIHSIEQLANIFRVSIQATAIRIAEVSKEPRIAILWNLYRKSKSKTLHLAWCLGPGRKPAGKPKYIPTQATVGHSSTIYKAYQSDSSVKSYKLFKVDNVIKRLPIESKGFGHGETRYVISLAFAER